MSNDEPINFIPDISLSRALVEPTLFGKIFAAPSFWPWRTVAKILDGEPLVEQREISLYEECTGRHYDKQATHHPVRRLILLAGRRAGKDRFLSACAIWRAALCCDWRKHISAGEQAVVILLGADKKQASILRKYCQGLLQVPLLAREVVRTTGELTEFKNGSSLEITTNDARLVRGRSAIAVLGSECCHWRTSELAASSDEEVVSAAIPSMSMCPDTGLLMLGSSVYRKRGYMYRKFRELYGNADSEDVCWFAPSTTMNPLLRQGIVDKALAEDSHKASVEFLGVWREDMSDLIPFDVIEASTDQKVYERPPVPGQTYRAFCDAAGGTGSDSYAFCIAHRVPGTEKIAMVDCLREYRPRFVPATVIRELAAICKKYNIYEIEGDKFAGGFHSDEWQRHGIKFKPCERTTAENYLTLLPMLLNNRVRLLDNQTLRPQLAGLERKMQPSGRETVDHQQISGAHDDLACACAGALAAVGSGYTYDFGYHGFTGEPDLDAKPAAAPPPLEPVRCNGDWWKSRPKSPTINSADENLKDLYAAFNNAIAWGQIR
jgi:hypothetical protein